jgi:hypothetical protein
MKPSHLILAALVCLTGCTSRVLTNTPRSAIEQLLLSGAVDKSLERLALPEVAGKKVFIDFVNLKAYDVEYIRAATRARFAKIGAVLVEKPGDADLIAEVASGGFGLEYKSSMVGLPAVPMPNAPVPTPELRAWKSVEQTGIFKLFIFIHAKGKFVAASHYYAKCDRDEGFTLWWRSVKEDDVREGWEKADFKLDTRGDTAKP